MGRVAQSLVGAAAAYLLAACLIHLTDLTVAAAWAQGAAGCAVVCAAWTLLRPTQHGPALLWGAALLSVAQGPPIRAGPTSQPPTASAVQTSFHVQSVERTRWGELRLVGRANGGPLQRVRSRFVGPVAAGDVLHLTARAEWRASAWRFDHAVWRRLIHRKSSRPQLMDMRTRALAWVRQSLPPPADAWAAALLFGEAWAAPFSQRSAYRDLGLLHLLSISGMHFWVWSALLRRLLPRPLRKLRWPLLTLLAALAEFSPAVTRAAVALGLRDACASRGLSVSPWSLWSVALAVETARTPRTSLGFLLSYAATAGLLLCRRVRLRSSVPRILLPSAAAALCTAPILHAHQATVEPWSIPLTPVFALLLPFRMLVTLFALPVLTRSGAASVLAAMDQTEAQLLGWVRDWAWTPGALPQVSSLFFGALCFLLIAILLAVRLAPWVRGIALAALLAMGLVSEAPAPKLLSHSRDWLVLASTDGTVIFPRHARISLHEFALDRSLLPLLAQARARGPWWAAGLSSSQLQRLRARLPSCASLNASAPLRLGGAQVHALPAAAGWWIALPEGDRIVLRAQSEATAHALARRCAALRPHTVYSPVPTNHSLDLAHLASVWRVRQWLSPSPIRKLSGYLEPSHPSPGYARERLRSLPSRRRRDGIPRRVPHRTRSTPRPVGRPSRPRGTRNQRTPLSRIRTLRPELS